MLISEAEATLKELREKHGDVPCWLVYDGHVTHLNYVQYRSVNPIYDSYINPPKDGVYLGVFLTEYEDEE